MKARTTLGLMLVFLASGFAALLYQVVWQRSLFAIYGINIESVTVVVTAFMLGLGFGSLAGGAVSKDPKRPVLLLFGLVELSIGAFGMVSLDLFHWVGALTLDLPPVATAIVTLLLVLLPTMLMGGTLPLLVAYSVRKNGNVGKSVGQLYFVNTLGSAIASVLSVMVMMGPLGERNTVRAAAAVNALVGLAVLGLHAMERSAERRRASEPPAIAAAAASGPRLEEAE
ncbi:MAG TPA: fused MFS/spermidine synthase [Polyangiaceae bacterium]|nr:fused MFS/spermidine synthase [Polyangiaceae bacterium]